MSNYGGYTTTIRQYLCSISLPNEKEALMFASKQLLPNWLFKTSSGKISIDTINKVISNIESVYSMYISQDEWKQLLTLMLKYEKLAAFT